MSRSPRTRQGSTRPDSRGTRTRRRGTPRRATRVAASPLARRAVGLVAVGLALAFVFTMFWMPVRDYFTQRTALAQKQAEFDTLADANEQLQTEVNVLQTPEGVRRAARDHLGFVMPGEKRVKLLPADALPTDLPASWPYSLVTGIVSVRQSIAAAGNAPLAPLSP